MPCTPTRIGLVNGQPVGAIVCGPKPAAKKCCGCGKRRAQRQCDWIVGRGIIAFPGPCSLFVCDECTTHPGGDHDKDLCPEHAKVWATHPLNPDSPINQPRRVRE